MSKPIIKMSMSSPMNPAMPFDLGNSLKMTAQQHSVAMNDGSTDPRFNGLSFDPLTKTDMGHIK
jgi:hypothetical protein